MNTTTVNVHSYGESDGPLNVVVQEFKEAPGEIGFLTLSFGSEDGNKVTFFLKNVKALLELTESMLKQAVLLYH